MSEDPEGFFVCIFLLNAGFHQNFTLGSFLCTDKFLVNRTENNSHGDFTEMFYL